MPMHRRCSKCRRWWPLTPGCWQWRKDQGAYRKDCKECTQAKSRQWSGEHRDHKHVYNQQYNQAHRSQIRITKRRWVQKNRTHVYQTNDRWRIKYPDKHRARAARYRSLRRGLLATLTIQEWNEILVYFEYKCAYCGTDKLPLLQEHVVPVSQGGEYTTVNIVPSCKPCNSRKFNRTPEQANMPLRKPWPIKEINNEMDKE